MNTNDKHLKDFFERIRHIASDIEKDLGLPKGFYNELGKEKSDWIYVIMIHSLLETALSYYLSEEYAKPHLEKTFARLPTADSSKGKIAFLVGTPLEEYIPFVKLLSNIRNAFAHDIKNVKLSLNEYLDSDEDTKNQFKSIFDRLVGSAKKDLYTSDSKLWIYLVIGDILETIYKRKTHWLAAQISEWLKHSGEKTDTFEFLSDLPSGTNISISTPSLSIAAEEEED